VIDIGCGVDQLRRPGHEWRKMVAQHVAANRRRAQAYMTDAHTQDRIRAFGAMAEAQKVYPTRVEAKSDVSDYIQFFYNPKRRHSTPGYLSPNHFETKMGLA